MASAGLRILLAIAVLCTPLVASGQAPALRGKVVNENGDGIAGVTVTLTRIGYSVRTDSAGEFALSGTPGSMLVFTMRAAGYRGDSGAVTLPRRGGVSREFRLVPEASAPPEVNPSDRVLRGRVTDTEGAPLSFASVQVNGGRRFIADDSGRFTLPSPSGRFSLLVRRIGFSPEELKLDTAPDTAIRVRMTAFATSLPEQRITGRAAFMSLDLNGFYRRMRDAERGVNHGYFMTPEDFEFRKPHQITQMVEGLPAVLVKKDGGIARKEMLVGSPCKPRMEPDPTCVMIGSPIATARVYRCVMTVYLDRVRIVGKLGSPDDFINEMVVPSSVAAMEVYPRGTGAPPEFQSLNGSCGVVLIWTK
jgi:Carboxypeptidase regulatory-like domain